MSKPPNILLLMSDEHRYDVAGFAGDPVVRTPFLDSLAAGGVVFDNAYCPSPICIPCRQAMATGQRPRTCGVERFGQDLPANSMTFARRLAQYGYHTTCAGKLHHTGPDQMQGWTRRTGLDLSVSDPNRGLRIDPSSFGPSLGDPKWSDAKEVQRAGVGRGTLTHDHDRAALDSLMLIAEATFANAYYDRPSGQRPQLMMLSFNRPHYPYFTTEDRFLYYLNRVPLPYMHDQPFDHPFLSRRSVEVGVDVTEREYRRAVTAYYGMIDEIDHDYARFADKLTELGQDLDDWWVFYTTDHGEMLGQHGIWEKQKFFEASARVPLVVRPPSSVRRDWGCVGRRVTQNVSLCDLFATLCDIADAPLPKGSEAVNGAGLESRSLLPLMRGETAQWDDESVSEFEGTNLMIKRGPLKYQWYDRPDCRSEPEVLFDLDADPSERTNLVNERRYWEAVETFRRRRDALGFAPSSS